MKGSTLAGVLLGAICTVAIACGGSRKMASGVAPPPGSATGADSMPGVVGDGRDQITRLDDEIRADLARAGLPEPSPTTMSPMCEGCTPMKLGQDITPPTSDATCKPGTSEKCQDSCKLGDSICSNASKICAVAADMNGDAWANGKCVDGKASCDAAKKRCCDCQL